MTKNNNNIKKNIQNINNNQISVKINCKNS